MRGGLERWKRGADSRGVGQALRYAFEGACDAHLSGGVDALDRYSGPGAVTRFIVADGTITTDVLDHDGLKLWLNGDDPSTGEHRGRNLESPQADLVLDGTINAPKSFSIAAMLNPDLAQEFEALQDRLRDRILLTWQRELNARRGAGGRVRESLQRIEVVELQHRRSRTLDPHIHRHLWLNVKVQGADGRWSNVDSRVAMKLHTVINAEGELAARTDPTWVAALARHGFTLNVDGEIAELAHLVRPLSRRSNQIEANRATHLAEWRRDHPAQSPGPDVLTQIDRWAWAFERPDKPNTLNESHWESRARAEIATLDHKALADRRAVVPKTTCIADLDRDLLAAKAIVDADTRSTSTGGRFSMFDVRAGAMRALAASGVCEDRDLLQEVIDDVVSRAAALTVNVLADERDVPQHVKHLLSAQTAWLKVDIAARFDQLAVPGVAIPRDAIVKLAVLTLPADVTLDEGQADAAAAIGGTDRLVTVIGPAGSGKTTMLRVAHAALTRQGRRMVVVAPTKKAASVASREIGTAASSLHALLLDHGWRFETDAAGQPAWTRLAIGDIDHETGLAYKGPRRYPLQVRDRIVVDEAGMADLHAARALAILAAETGAGIAMVGDDLQARPVGHAGAMACMARRSTAAVELTAVHRFDDPDYARLTLRMRQPRSVDDAAAVAGELARRGLIHRVSSDEEAREAMVDAYFDHTRQHSRIALVTATNAEADVVSETIQQRRVDLGELRDDVIALGSGDQRLLVGDIVQTRRNDRDTGVENRALWTVSSIETGCLALASIEDPLDRREVSADYAADHVHLAYASTVHGVQGETTEAALVGPGVDAAGIYVGMTRGRHHNAALVVARTGSQATREIAATLLRGTIEITIDDARRAAEIDFRRAARALIDGGSPLVSGQGALKEGGQVLRR